MNRVLVPVNGTPRSLMAVEHIKTTFSPKSFEIILLMIHEDVVRPSDKEEIEKIQRELDERLQLIADNLPRYSVIRKVKIGEAGPKIIECAQETGASIIVLTRSTKQDNRNMIGKTAAYVIRNAGIGILVVPDRLQMPKSTYRGLIYRKPNGTVNLRGAMSMKQSECLLPSVRGSVIYEIRVTRGRVRFIHRAYNEDTKDWDLPPDNEQDEFVDISTGETKTIPVNAEGVSRIPDRIRIVNRDMKYEAVFQYRILPNHTDERAESITEKEAGLSDELNALPITEITDVDKPEEF